MLFPSPTSKRKPLTTSYHQASKNLKNMCKAVDMPSKGVSGEQSTRSFAAAIPSVISSSLRLFRSPYSIRKIILLLLITSILGTLTLYKLHSGFRRTIQFWRGFAPFIIQYKYVKIKAERFDHVSPEELKRRLDIYREATAPQLVDLIIQMGGIYVKIGQVMSTIGQGLLPQQYIDALQPLQDGMPPRSYDQVSTIIKQSTGKSMDDLFVDFDEKPIGAASIAQVHRATLRPQNEGEEPRPVVIKIQYPEVEEQFEADLSNMEFATRLVAPENIDMVKAMRKRHENELDFRLEANNMREVTKDMQQYGVEPSLVRIPRVVDDLCTKNVLAMEYLEGVSLSDAIEQEQHSLARAMGKQDANELKQMLASRMREHFESGGGAGSGGMQMVGDKKMKLMKVLGPSAASVLRTYASVRDSVADTVISLTKLGAKIPKVGTNLVQFPLTSDKGDLDYLITDSSTKKKKKAKVNLHSALKTLVHVHGLQLLGSGLYNADPHPGNVLILPDGRLGLLDYGLVGRLSKKDCSLLINITLQGKQDNIQSCRLACL